MKYNDNNLQSSLAAQYVLGTLRGAARKRFESLRVQNRDIQEAVNYWESQLNAMATSIEPVSPPQSIWINIEQMLGFVSKQQDQSESTLVTIRNERVTSDMQAKPSANQAWKAITSVAVAASFVLAIFFVQFNKDINYPEAVAIFANNEQQTLWSLDVRKNHIFVRSTQNLEKLAQKDYQLWIVPASGDQPISIGLLQQEGSFTLPKPENFDHIQIAALAVSLEPKGGSPTGAPTEVLFATELALL
ncbi:anti-sigma factor domain-containing protein [Glaciecola sp. KUL10]|uniref:anti-sigma factor n=1 Tax=Glaciecola sp. (strain KUL10) TaxID=2161813 RepID=UPI000D78BE27|nr:anti-sigma factor [Glaciecola sp. KUL10]GBL04959.1 hypothetical protein KUL10_22770 [Glaciecola sp. KUL10]